MADLPRPKVEVVDTPDDKKHLVISREEGPSRTPRAKSFEIRGKTEKERLENLGRDMINDRKTGEWLP